MPKSLQSFLGELRDESPEDLLHIDKKVDPDNFDVTAILDALGASTFVTMGWSGGGPHALACAALLPDRCAAATSLAGVAPYPADGLDWLAGMGQENIEEFSAAIEGESALSPALQTMAKDLHAIQGADVAAALGGLVSDVDKRALTGEFAGAGWDRGSRVFHRALGAAGGEVSWKLGGTP